MSRKIYVYVGNWSFEAKPEKGKGVSIFSYEEETGDMTLLETIRPDVAGGQMYLDGERQILYVSNECGERRGEIGGGGYVMAYRINPEDGSLSLMNEKESLCPEPSYLCMDQTKRYLIACHCSDPWHVTKIVKRKDGTYANEVLFDDTALVMFRIQEDGSLGDVCDVAITEGTGGKDPRSQVNVDPVSGHIQLVEVISRLHSVVKSPSGGVFAVCDKGMDRIYTYRIDYEKECLMRLDEWVSEDVACFPRYGAFHPTLPVFYANNENHATLNCFHCDEEIGKLQCTKTIDLLSYDPGMVDGKPVGAQDILVHPSGKCMYVTLCGLNLIIVLHLDEEGNPTCAQEVKSGGVLPRGLGMSPDQRFLLSGNMVSGDITTFAVAEDGTLTSTGKVIPAVSPSAIRFFVSEEPS